MSTSPITLPFRLPRARSRALAVPRPELLVLLALAAVLDLWALDRNGFANEYYSAAVRSMAHSWHAFLYGSFDANGIMTVDKPPLSLWVQALSVRAFGFTSWSLLVPQALMGVLTVGLAYDLVRRRFGRGAGFAGGLVLALTPVTVAISRHNNPDALLVLCSTAAVWSLVRGLEDGRTRWLVLSGVCVGLGFEAKMGAALLVVPGIAAAWLWVAPRGRWAAVRQLVAGGAAMSAVGLAWPVLMWLTPAAGRPWVSGTSDNSIWSLILGYNGFGRLLGQDGGPGGGAGGPGGPGGGGPGGLFGGEPGALRLLNQALGGQGGWLLGLALVAGVLVVVATRMRRADARTGWLIAVGGTFAVTAVAFSKAQGIFHPYYVSALAPFTAALVGAGGAEVAKGGRIARLGGPLAIAGGAVTELAVLHDNPGRLAWVPPLVLVVAGAAAVALAAGVPARARTIAVAAALGALLIAPGAWAFQTLGHAANGTFPAGGPASAGLGGFGGRGGPPPGFAPGAGATRSGSAGAASGSASASGFAPGAGGPPPGAPAGAPSGSAGVAPPAAAPPAFPGGSTGAGRGTAPAFGGPGGGPFGGDSQSLNAAIRYVKAHGGGTIAVASQSGATGPIIASGADVAAIGGFSGRESQVSIAWLADAVEAGRISWVVSAGSTGFMPRDTRVGASDVMSAARKVGTRVRSVSGLYDLRGKAAALRALA